MRDTTTAPPYRLCTRKTPSRLKGRNGERDGEREEGKKESTKEEKAREWMDREVSSLLSPSFMFTSSLVHSGFWSNAGGFSFFLFFLQAFAFKIFDFKLTYNSILDRDVNLARKRDAIVLGSWILHKCRTPFPRRTLLERTSREWRETRGRRRKGEGAEVNALVIVSVLPVLHVSFFFSIFSFFFFLLICWSI